MTPRRTATSHERFVAFLRCADESTLGRTLVEGAILLSASRNNASQLLRNAAAAYQVNTDAIALKVRQEIAAKEKARKAVKSEPAERGLPVRRPSMLCTGCPRYGRQETFPSFCFSVPNFRIARQN